MNSILVDWKFKRFFSKSSSSNFLIFGLCLRHENTSKKYYPRFGRKFNIIIYGPILFLHETSPTQVEPAQPSRKSQPTHF
jgi:hypothetical protein